MLIKFKYPALFIAVLVAFNIFYPFQIHIEDAILETPVSNYGIDISVVRVIFEPFVGPLLFSLRGHQPLVEFLVVMLWFMLLLLPIQIFSAKKNSLPVSKALTGWLSLLPIVLSFWIFLILVLVFAPLPANKITNQNKDKILLNIHSHTHWSHDGIISPEALMKWHLKNGFDAFFLTEHNNHNKTLELIKDQQNETIPQKPVVLAGQEYSGSNHILLLGLSRDFNTKDMPDSTAIDSARANDGVAIVAHWFAHGKHSPQHYINQGAVGFEIANQGEGITYDRDVFQKIISSCKGQNLLMLGSCDYHGYGSAAFSWNALEIPGWHNMDLAGKRQSIMEIFRNFDQKKIQVLVYRDRDFVSTEKILLSPLFNFIGYYRSLNPLQIFSWMIWMVVLTIILGRGRSAFLTSFKHWATLGTVCSATILLKGVHLLSKVKAVKGYNEIYIEYGEIFLWVGIGLLLYSMMVLIIQQRR